MKTILVTGGNGFLGKHLVQALVEQGHTVRVTVRNFESVPPQKNRVKYLAVGDLFTLGDEVLDKLVQGIDILIHVAWYTLPSDYMFSYENISCLQGSLRLAQSFVRNGGKRFVGIGSCYEYDASYGYLRPATPLNPNSLYGECKVGLARVLAQYFKQAEISFLWLRLFYLYGMDPACGEHPVKLVPYLHNQLSRGEPANLSAGNQVKDYLEVNQAAQLILQASLSSAEGFHNICSGRGISIRELAAMIAESYGRSDLLQFDKRAMKKDETPFMVGEPYDGQ